jgi:hypothetical protein
MKRKAVVSGQYLLGVSALVWSAFLLPRTGFLWWILGNLAYGTLALIAATLYAAKIFPIAEKILVVIGGAIFVCVNGTALLLACATGGACGIIFVVSALMSTAQIALGFFRLTVGNSEETAVSTAYDSRCSPQ